MRSDNPEMVELLRALLAPSLVPGVDADPNLSAWFGRQQGAVRDLAALYRHGTTCFRTPDPGRVLHAVPAYLDGYLPAPEGLLPLESWALVGAEGVVLVNDYFTSRLRVADGVFRREGWTQLDGAVQHLDPNTHEIVVSEPRVALDQDVLAHLRTTYPRAFGQAVAPGRHRIIGLVLLGAKPDPVKVTSPARRLASLAALLQRPGRRIVPEHLAVIGQLAAEVPVIRHMGEDDNDIVHILRKLGGGNTATA